MENFIANHVILSGDPFMPSSSGVCPNKDSHSSGHSYDVKSIKASPSTGSPRIIATSCRVIDISPCGMSNACVSGRHLSTKTVNKCQSNDTNPCRAMP